MSKTLLSIALIVAAAAWVPLGLIALSRSRPSTKTAIHPVLDMDKQVKFKAQRANAMFADVRADRPEQPGAVAIDDLIVADLIINDPASHDRILFGVEKLPDGKMAFVTQLPLPVDMELMRRGENRFNIYCAACHGMSGYGDGAVARRAAEMQAAGSSAASGWVAPANYHTDQLRSLPVGQLFNTIKSGVRTMPSHGSQIPVYDRWAIAAYLKALQRSQHAGPDDWPEAGTGDEERGAMEEGPRIRGQGPGTKVEGTGDPP
jgi:mono/diheme cytochrome c family protein